MNSHHCPFVTTDFELVRRFLTEMPLHDLIFFTEQVFNQLSAAEKVTYDINRYCSDYSDYEGRINFIRTLLDSAIISMAHIPLTYQSDPRVIELIRSKAYEYYIPIARELSSEAAALTDDLETTPASTITVTNPRWAHVDEARKEESPAIAAIGNTVELLVDVTGYPEGAPVTFDIFDAGTDPAMRIETERGKNEGGTARIQWVVSDPNERGAELKLSFEGSARSKSSGQAPIDLKPVSKMYRAEVVDDEGKAIEGVKVEFTVAGKATIVPTDEKGIAEHPAEDPAVEADVRILWEEGAAGSGGEEGATTVPATDGGEDATTITAPVASNDEETAEDSAKGYEVFLFDEDDQPIEGKKVFFKVDTEEKTVETDDKGRAFLAAEEGASADTAEVEIVW
ncbi:MAG: hypothetical protein JW913_05565 [Chitinispirillaceae bacterium]|nr:hypothetical protein [Chitinispirillaceae bacterium]